jgi:hypothetical protein
MWRHVDKTLQTKGCCPTWARQQQCILPYWITPLRFLHRTHGLQRLPDEAPYFMEVVRASSSYIRVILRPQGKIHFPHTFTHSTSFPAPDLSVGVLTCLRHPSFYRKDHAETPHCHCCIHAQGRWHPPASLGTSPGSAATHFVPSPA